MSAFLATKQFLQNTELLQLLGVVWSDEMETKYQERFATENAPALPYAALVAKINEFHGAAQEFMCHDMHVLDAEMDEHICEMSRIAGAPLSREKLGYAAQFKMALQ